MSTNEKTLGATFSGYIALLFWAISAALANSLIPIPTFEILAIAFGISFAGTATYVTIRKRWYIIKQPIMLWVIGILGIFGNDILFLEAFKHAPPAHIILITYLWPMLVILLSALILKEAAPLRYFTGGLFGLAGIAVLMLTKSNAYNIHGDYALGYLLALLSAIVWSIFVIAMRHYKNKPIEMVGMYCGCGFILSLIAHIIFDKNVTPTSPELLVLIIFGLTSQGSAYYLWNHGIRRGNFKLLSISSYATPVVSIVILILLGKSNYSNRLLVSALLVSGGSFICHIPLSLCKHYFISLTRYLFNKSRH